LESARAAEAPRPRRGGGRRSRAVEGARRTGPARLGRRRTLASVSRGGQDAPRKRRRQRRDRQGSRPRERPARHAALPAVAGRGSHAGRGPSGREIFFEGGGGAARGRGIVHSRDVPDGGIVRGDRKRDSSKGGSPEFGYAVDVSGSA